MSFFPCNMTGISKHARSSPCLRKFSVCSLRETGRNKFLVLLLRCKAHSDLLGVVLNIYTKKLSISFFVSFDFPFFLFVNVIGVSVTFAL
jgi:hypothetical protein